jgi:single-stranded DNA-specific DHH superfamily exonuclease
MLEYQAGLIRDIAKKSSVWNIAGVEFLAANGPCIATEICDALQKGYEGPTASFEVMGDIVKFSLRSIGDYSVSAIASKFPGGGGHKTAAGFSLPLDKVDWANRRLVP